MFKGILQETEVIFKPHGNDNKATKGEVYIDLSVQNFRSVGRVSVLFSFFYQPFTLKNPYHSKTKTRAPGG